MPVVIFKFANPQIEFFIYFDKSFLDPIISTSGSLDNKFFLNLLTLPMTVNFTFREIEA